MKEKGKAPQAIRRQAVNKVIADAAAAREKLRAEVNPCHFTPLSSCLTLIQDASGYRRMEKVGDEWASRTVVSAFCVFANLLFPGASPQCHMHATP